MSEKKFMIQDFVAVEAEKISDTVKDLIADGYRVTQICATNKGEKGIELLYSFDKDHVLKNLRVMVPENGEISSISDVCWAAFIYENELHDLFGIDFRHLALDYGGHFFRISEKTPWNPQK